MKWKIKKLWIWIGLINYSCLCNDHKQWQANDTTCLPTWFVTKGSTSNKNGNKANKAGMVHFPVHLIKSGRNVSKSLSRTRQRKSLRNLTQRLTSCCYCIWVIICPKWFCNFHGNNWLLRRYLKLYGDEI